MARSARAEASLPVTCVDGVVTAALKRGVSFTEPEVALHLDLNRLPRLTHAPPITRTDSSIVADSQLVTGGTGGLGLLTARWLAQHGALRLLLASRGGGPPKPPPPQARVDPKTILSEDDARSKLAALGLDEAQMAITTEEERSIRSLIAKHFRYVTSSTSEEALEAMGEDSSGSEQARFERFLGL